MKTNTSDEQDIFKTGTQISDSGSFAERLPFVLPVVTLFRYFKERFSPKPKLEITAQPVEVQELWSRKDGLISTLLIFLPVINIIRYIEERWNHKPIETTATPVDVQDIWSKQSQTGRIVSALVHVGIIGAVIAVPVATVVHSKAAQQDLALLEPINISLPPAAQKSGGGGGGGSKMKTPASKGQLPKASTFQLVPPTTIITNMAPELVAEPTVIVPQLVNLQHFDSLIPIGLPTGVAGPPSNGPGSGAGIGNGNGHGVGDGDGAGVGPGKGIGIGGGPYKVGGAGGASAPACPRVEPNYSDEARRAHIQGAVVLDAIVEKDGTIQPNKVINGLGYGLDDEAIKSVKTWKCTPGKYEGQPVAVSVRITINFRLY
jgi:protein TonB